MERSKNGTISPRLYAVIILTVLAPLLGGTTKLWAQAVVALGTGALILFSPPRKSLGLLPNVAFLLLFALALAAFLPAHWLPTAEWRTELAKLGVHLPGTISPQPWLTFESVLLLLLELSWAYYVLAGDWSLAERRKGWFLFAATIVVLAGTLTVCFFFQKRIPFWPRVPEYGFFPNRNHTSNVLGLGGILIYALALRGFDEGRRNWWVWLPALSLICWALILNYSRAGIILLCGGILAWHLYWFITSEHKRRPLLASGAILLLLGLFAWNGGRTALRFGRETAGEFLSPSTSIRLAIYRDAAGLSFKSPFTGVGLGNFSAIFTTQRHEAIFPKIAGHPESDWIWAAVELGWLAPILIGLLFVWWATRCFPFQPGTFRVMRMAAFICGCGFALHAFFDVPAHQIGALWPALFLASTAINPMRGFAESRAVSFVFRGIGAGLVIAALAWFGALGGFVHLPNRATLDQLTETRRAERDQGDYADSVAAATQALRIAPLDWSAYEGRGAAELALHLQSDAMRDFAASRYLLPDWSDVWLKQGLLWASSGEIDRAFDLWTAMLQRFPQEAARLYGQIFDWVKLDPDLVDRWRQLGRVNKQCLLSFFQSAGPVEFQIELERLLSEDPELKTFDREQKAAFFAAWYHTGDKLALAQTLKEHPEWQKIAWRQLTLTYADYGDYRPAYETLHQFLPAPDLPGANTSEASTDLRPRFRLNPTDLNLGFALYSAQIREGKSDEALATLESLVPLPGSPKYLWYLEAELWAQKKEWQKAWQALKRYEMENK